MSLSEIGNVLNDPNNQHFSNTAFTETVVKLQRGVSKYVNDAFAKLNKNEIMPMRQDIADIGRTVISIEEDLTKIKNEMINKTKLFSQGPGTKQSFTGGLLSERPIGLILSGTYLQENNKPEADKDLNEWKDEMEYFTMIIKTMIAKTFITIGYYDLLERPGDIPALAPIRMILGGADEYPKIEDKAIELYIRLPLLAEYYRELFNFDESHGKDKSIKFSMLPEMDGIFSKLIKMIFKTTKYINVGTYTDNDTKELILIVNEIYNKFVSEPNPIYSVIYAFIAEVNRRYGIVTEKDRKSYNELYANTTTYPTEGVELSKISLLPGEEEIQPRRSAPSEYI